MLETLFSPKIIESLFIGVSIAAIPGPIFFELIRRTLTKGLSNGVWLVLGEFSGNFLLLLLIFFGISHILTMNIAKIVLSIIGGLILCKIGIDSLRIKQEDIEQSYKNSIKTNKSFFAGLSIAITSPIVIALWISLSGSYLAIFKNSYVAFFHIFFITLGFLVFFIPLAILIHVSRRKISSKHVVILSKVFGTILIFYGILLFYQIINLF